MGTVVIENTRTGQQKTISQRTWDLMANSKERGDTRKGWRALKGVTATPTKANPATVKTPTMIPPSIQAAADAALEAERKAEALMISGAKPEELGEAPAAEVAAPSQEATQVGAAPAEEGKEADLPTELAGLDESLTPKVAQVLAKAGIATKAQLKAATLPTVNKALDAAGLGAKKAQAAGWKSKVATAKA
ncbi:MAG TPA: hypothetical protein PLR96_09870 [Flavobacteriales bacterium]|jgi:hypothetical protein|nr:hypothetical protein [Flavobacteriales bacterium]